MSTKNKTSGCSGQNVTEFESERSAWKATVVSHPRAEAAKSSSPANSHKI
jgi:hypothetical protein